MNEKNKIAPTRRKHYKSCIAPLEWFSVHHGEKLQYLLEERKEMGTCQLLAQ